MPRDRLPKPLEALAVLMAKSGFEPEPHRDEAAGRVLAWSDGRLRLQFTYDAADDSWDLDLGQLNFDAHAIPAWRAWLEGRVARASTMTLDAQFVAQQLLRLRAKLAATSPEAVESQLTVATNGITFREA